jgi:tetratricopeptide (TPR) repeat protein
VSIRFRAGFGLVVVALLGAACGPHGDGAGSPAAPASAPPSEARCAADDRRLETALDDDLDAGHLDAALRKASDALADCERELGPRHVVTSRVRVKRARVLEKAGRFDVATEQAQTALGVFEKELGEANADVASALQVIARAAIDGKDYARAKTVTLRIVALRERIGPPVALAAQLGNLGLVYSRLGQKPEAIEALSRALDIARKNRPEESAEVALALAQLGEAYRLQGNVEAAEPLLVESLAIFERILGADHDRVASAANNLAALYHYGSKDLAKAEPLYRRALAIHRSHAPPGHVYTAQTLVNLGTLLCEKGQWDEGRALFDEGITNMDKVVGPDAPEVKRARDRFAQLRPPSPNRR